MTFLPPEPAPQADFQTGVAFAACTFGVFFAGGAFYIPLMTLLRQGPDKGGLGLSPAVITGIALSLAAAYLGSLVLVRSVERLAWPRPRLIASLLAVAIAIALGSAQVLQSAQAGNHSWLNLGLLAAGVFSFALFNTSAYALINGLLLQSPWQGRFAWFRVIGTGGYVAAGCTLSYSVPYGAGYPAYLAAGMLLIILWVANSHLPNLSAQLDWGLERAPLTTVQTLPLRALLGYVGWGVLVVIASSAVVARLYDLNINLCLSNQPFIGRPSAIQMLGQTLEVVLLLAMPYLRGRISYRYMLLAGPLAWSILYALLVYGVVTKSWIPIVIALPLQGFNCLFMTAAACLAGERVPASSGGSAQALISASQGAGMILGTLLSGQLMSQVDLQASTSWQTLWQTATVLSVGVTVLAVVLLRPARVGAASATKD